MGDPLTARQRSRPGPWSLLVVTFTSIGLVLSGSARAWQKEPGAATAPDGAELFKTYCASCHGADGTGDGPLAPVLRHAPPDLAQLSRRNGWIFPAARVHRIVDGQDVESHGDRDMPVWGDAFKVTRDGRSRATADARIAAIVRYLESIQHLDAH